jgi:tetratricopeptide (TPR) repeat protein
MQRDDAPHPLFVTDWLRRSAATLLAAGALTMTAGPALADAVKMGQFWIRDADVLDVEDGQLVYVTPTGNDARRPLSEVEAIRVDELPQLEAGDKALEAQNYEQALAAYREAAGQAESSWLKQYAQGRQAKALFASGQNEAGLEQYLALAGAGTHAGLLPEPPADWLAQADEPTRQRLAQSIEQALSGAEGSAAETLRRLQKIAQSPAEAEGEGSDGGGDDTGQAAAAALKPLGIALPKDIGGGPIVKLLAAKKFDQAIDKANAQLSDARDTSRQLYLRGIAQLARAEQTGQREQYLDAGLSFMAVEIYFGHRAGTFVGPSLVEAGYVHEKINRSDKATELYDQARQLLDESDDPVYFKHWQTRRGG